VASGHHKKGGSHRSNRSSVYSVSKCTNWGYFDPFGSEVRNFPRRLRPVTELVIDAESTVSIFEKGLHPRFIRPYTAGDVAAVLRRMPRESLVGLRRVNLLGGTSKQDRVAFGPQFYSMAK